MLIANHEGFSNHLDFIRVFAPFVAGIRTANTLNNFFPIVILIAF